MMNKISDFFKGSLANILLSIKVNYHLPVRAIIIMMSISGFFIRYFITSDIVNSAILNAIVVIIVNYFIVFFVLKYILSDEKKNEKNFKIPKNLL